MIVCIPHAKVGYRQAIFTRHPGLERVPGFFVGGCCAGPEARRLRQRRCKSRDAARTIPSAWSKAPDQTAPCIGSRQKAANELNCVKAGQPALIDTITQER